MQTTEKNSKEKSASLAPKKEEQIRSLESGGQSDLQKIQPQSVMLSKDLSMQLMALIKEVNKTEVTPETVNASCNAAAQIYKLLRLNFEMKKEGF